MAVVILRSVLSTLLRSSRAPAPDKKNAVDRGRGQVDRRGGAMAHAAGDAGPDLALAGQEDEGAAVLDRDAARREAGLFIRLELGGEGRPEAEMCKAHWRNLLGYGWTDAWAPSSTREVSPARSPGGRSDAAHGGGACGRAHCLPPSVADSYRLRVATVCRGVNPAGRDD